MPKYDTLSLRGMIKNIIRSFVPDFLLDWYHLILALTGAFLYGFPSRKLIVVGVTGTNGKSTVVEMCHQVFMEAGFKVASLSSIRFKIQNEARANNLKMTMPGRFQLQKFLRQTVRAGCQYAVLEVTSEGIKQYRHKFVDFDVAVFTNLTPEHIESHGSFEAYKKAKGELFRALKVSRSKPKTPKVSIVNLDDSNNDYFLQLPADEKFRYGFKPDRGIAGCRLVKAVDVKSFSGGSDFTVEGIPMRINLLGGFNIYNALAAICVGMSQGVGLEVIKKALEGIIGVPGRMEIVAVNPFAVIVDYAHTPDALRKVYQTVRESDRVSEAGRKLICVFGAAGGGRDKWKRPELGKIAAQYCDQIILTNEDPYDEDPGQILLEIESGIKDYGSRITQYLDRREAIRKALSAAQAGDMVIITGKGSEPWMCVSGGKKIPWDDRGVAKEELNAIVR